jgi:hypothetical protein
MTMMRHGRAAEPPVPQEYDGNAVGCFFVPPFVCKHPAPPPPRGRAARVHGASPIAAGALNSQMRPRFVHRGRPPLGVSHTNEPVLPTAATPMATPSRGAFDAK